MNWRMVFFVLAIFPLHCVRSLPVATLERANNTPNLWLTRLSISPPVPSCRRLQTLWRWERKRTKTSILRMALVDQRQTRVFFAPTQQASWMFSRLQSLLLATGGRSVRDNMPKEWKRSHWNEVPSGERLKKKSLSPFQLFRISPSSIIEISKQISRGKREKISCCCCCYCFPPKAFIFVYMV